MLCWKIVFGMPQLANVALPRRSCVCVVLCAFATDAILVLALPLTGVKFWGSRATEDMPRGRRQGAEPFNICTVCHFIQLPSKLHNSHVVCTCPLGTQCPPPGNGIDASMVRAAERTLLSHQKNIVESWSMLGITLINYSNCTTSSW